MFTSLKEIANKCVEEKRSFYEVVLEIDSKQNGLQKEEELKKMTLMWKAMKDAANTYDPELLSSSKLTGGDGGKFESYIKNNNSICGGFLGQVIACALQMSESNACMKRIVASPTAGSCGVLPAVLIPLFRNKIFSEEKIIESLFVAAGIGQVIANRASISGAEGGCQAEIGAASSMAAGTLVYLYNGNSEQICAASGFALQNLLGLVCDPVAGLVEIPCVKRNVIGAVNACSCADMALASIIPKIPADEIIDAMKSIGNKMDSSLKETAQGGMASTPSAKLFEKQIKTAL